MKLLILHHAWVFGGAERTTFNLINYLDPGVVRNVVLAAPAELYPCMPRRGEWVDSGPLIKQGMFSDLAGLREDVMATCHLLERVRPDLALGMMHYSAALVTLATRFSRYPVKSIASFRGPFYEYMSRYETGVRRRAFLRLAVSATARGAHALIVPSRGTAKEARRRFFAPSGRLHVIPNGIDHERVLALSKEPAGGLEALPAELPRLCVAARLSAEKEIMLVIKAMGLMRDSRPCALILVGGGEQRAALEARARDLGIAERILFTGHVENVFPYIRAADLYLHTCQFEGFGYSMLEAMTCGTPVIATDCPHGPREVLAEGRAGLLVAPGSAADLAAGIERLLGDPGLRQHFREQGLRRAAELSMEKMARGYERVFRAMVADSSSGAATPGP